MGSHSEPRETASGDPHTATRSTVAEAEGLGA